MKPLFVLAVLAFPLALVPPLAAQNSKGKPATGKPTSLNPSKTPTAVPTSEQIRRRQAAAKIDPKIQAAEKPIEMGTIRSAKDASLLERSTVLSHGKFWTLVPKEAVLHVPPHLAARANGERQGDLVPFQQFLATNDTWVHTQQVSLAQARGEAPISEDTVKRYKGLGQIIVAVCHGGPISVKPPKAAGDGKPVAPGAGPARVR